MPTLTIVTLDALAQSYDHDLTGVFAATQDTPVLFGGGSISDGSDSSYVEIGTWRESDGTEHIEVLSANFALPPGHGAPTALALKIRLRNSPDAIADPPSTAPSVLYAELDAVADNTLLGAVDFFHLDEFHVINGEVVDPTDFAFWFGDFADLDNPTDSGGWFEFAPNADDPAAVVAALTGDGIQVSITVFSDFTLDETPRRRPWLDVFEFQLLVACESAGISPLRRYPPVNNGGFGPTRHWPRSPNRRAGKSY